MSHHNASDVSTPHTPRNTLAASRTGLATAAAAACLLPAIADAGSTRWDRVIIDPPTQISADLPSDFDAFDLCWSGHAESAKAELARLIGDQLTSSDLLYELSLPGIAPDWRALPVGVLEDMNGGAIDRELVNRERPAYQTDIDAALADVLARVEADFPGVRISVAGFAPVSRGRGVDIAHNDLLGRVDFIVPNEGAPDGGWSPSFRQSVIFSAFSEPVGLWALQEGMPLVFQQRNVGWWLLAPQGHELLETPDAWPEPDEEPDDGDTRASNDGPVDAPVSNDPFAEPDRTGSHNPIFTPAGDVVVLPNNAASDGGEDPGDPGDSEPDTDDDPTDEPDEDPIDDPTEDPDPGDAGNTDEPDEPAAERRRLNAGMNAAGRPVAVWAIRDRFPIDADTATVAVAAIDSFAGIAEVRFSFSMPVESGGATSTTHAVSAPSWMDLFGHGHEADYWTVTISTAGLSEDIDVTVDILTEDGVLHENVPNADRTLRFMTEAPRVLYLDDDGDDANDGLTPETAKRTIMGAIKKARTSYDQVRVLPGEYELPRGPSAPIHTTARKKYLRWIAEEGPGSVRFIGGGAGTSSTTVRDYMSFEGIDFFFPNTGLRSPAIHHLNYENCTFEFAKNTGAVHFYDATHVSIIDCQQFFGYRGPVFNPLSGNPTTDVIVSGFKIAKSGTAISLSSCRSLCERVVAIANATGDGYTPDIHFDFITSPINAMSPHELEDMMIRYTYAVDNGDHDHGHNYNFFLLGGVGRNIAMYNNISYSIQSAQQVLQLSHDWQNVQIVHNTLLGRDNEKTLNLSGQAASDTPTSAHFASRNNVLHSLETTTGNASYRPLHHINGDKITGPALYTFESFTWTSAHGRKPYEQIVPGGREGLQLYLPDYIHPTTINTLADVPMDIPAWKFAPRINSPSIGKGGDTDVRFDFDGNPRPLVGSTVGAKEFAG